MSDKLTENQQRAIRCISDGLAAGLAERGIDARTLQVLGRQTPGGGLDIWIRSVKGETIAATQIGPILAWNAPTEATFATLGRELSARVDKVQQS